MCGALCLRQHETARSYLSDSPTRKSSTHSTIITRNRSYVNHRLRPKFFILSSFCKTFAYTTLNGVRGNGRDQFSLEGTAFCHRRTTSENIERGPGENSHKILSATTWVAILSRDKIHLSSEIQIF